MIYYGGPEKCQGPLVKEPMWWKLRDLLRCLTLFIGRRASGDARRSMTRAFSRTFSMLGSDAVSAHIMLHCYCYHTQGTAGCRPHTENCDQQDSFTTMYIFLRKIEFKKRTCFMHASVSQGKSKVGFMIQRIKVIIWHQAPSQHLCKHQAVLF